MPKYITLSGGCRYCSGIEDIISVPDTMDVPAELKVYNEWNAERLKMLSANREAAYQREPFVPAPEYKTQAKFLIERGAVRADFDDYGDD